MKIKKIFRSLLFLSFLSLGVSCSKYSKEDLSLEEPFKSIIGKTLITKNVCYIAENVEALVKENAYVMQMDDEFIAKKSPIYIIPIGTNLNIEKATYFIKGPGQFAYKNVLGTVFIKELNKEVAFEYEWEPQVPKNMGEDRYGYQVYALAPWQDKPLPLKFDTTDGSASPYRW